MNTVGLVKARLKSFRNLIDGQQKVQSYVWFETCV